MQQAATYNMVEDLLDRNIAAGRSEKLAFVDDKRSITYGALAASTRRIANALRQLGVRREERIAMVMLDSVDFPAVFLGAIRAGIIPVPLNTLLTPEQTLYILRDSRARVLFISSSLYATLAPLLTRLADLEHVVIDGTDDVHAGTSALHLASLVSSASDVCDTAATCGDEPAFWLYSSGSTGSPKGVKHVHSSAMATARQYAGNLLHIVPEDVCLSAAKLFFAYGLGNGLTFPMSVGATAILHPGRPTPAAMFALMRQHRPSLYFGVPTLYAAMLADTDPSYTIAASSLRLCVSAGEALPEHVGLAWKARFGSDILDGVGSTEMLHIYLSNRVGDLRYGTSGRPVPGYDVRLLDDRGAEIADGDIGEMYVQGPSAAEGYWNQRDKTRTTFAGDWTRTGDKYTRDTQGRYTYCGRADDMFKVSGLWVSPFEVEGAIISHAAVLEAAVIPSADTDGLIKPKAYVVLKAGASAADFQASIREHVKAAIGAWKYPRWVEIVDTLPKTATGKIQRFRLRERDAADQAGTTPNA